MVKIGENLLEKYKDNIMEKEPYTMEQAIWCKLKQHGIESHKAMKIGHEIEDMIVKVYMNTNHRRK